VSATSADRSQLSLLDWNCSRLGFVTGDDQFCDNVNACIWIYCCMYVCMYVCVYVCEYVNGCVLNKDLWLRAEDSQFLNQPIQFLFSHFCSIYPTHVSAVTLPSSRYIDKFASQFTVHLVLSQPLHCLRLLFTLTITGLQSFLKCLAVYSVYVAFELYSIALYIVNIEHYVVGSCWNR
jgi:hypothetical protein